MIFSQLCFPFEYEWLDGCLQKNLKETSFTCLVFEEVHKLSENRSMLYLKKLKILNFNYAKIQLNSANVNHYFLEAGTQILIFFKHEQLSNCTPFYMLKHNFNLLDLQRKLYINNCIMGKVTQQVTQIFEVWRNLW